MSGNESKARMELGPAPSTTPVCVFGCGEVGEDHERSATKHHCNVLLQLISQLEYNVKITSDKQTDLSGRLQDMEEQLDNLIAMLGNGEAYGADQEIRSEEQRQQLHKLMNIRLPMVENVNNKPNEQSRQVVGLRDKVTYIEREMALKDAAFTEINLRLTELENTSYDGTFVWRINDFSRKRQEAVNGRTPSIYSTPFYTSRAGYKDVHTYLFKWGWHGEGNPYLSLLCHHERSVRCHLTLAIQTEGHPDVIGPE